MVPGGSAGKRNRKKLSKYGWKCGLQGKKNTNLELRGKEGRGQIKRGLASSTEQQRLSH